MKRTLTVITLLAPTLAFAQGQSIASGSLIGGIHYRIISRLETNDLRNQYVTHAVIT